MHQEPKIAAALEDSVDSESRLRLIVDKTPGLIYSARPDGYIDFFNQQCLEFLGVPLEEIAGWGWTRTVHSDDIEAF
jgi:PAS domain S-box-containing protein